MTIPKISIIRHTNYNTETRVDGWNLHVGKRSVFKPLYHKMYDKCWHRQALACRPNRSVPTTPGRAIPTNLIIPATPRPTFLPTKPQGGNADNSKAQFITDDYNLAIESGSVHSAPYLKIESSIDSKMADVLWLLFLDVSSWDFTGQYHTCFNLDFF